jgi:uroporphyrinogen decarboxylase
LKLRDIVLDTIQHRQPQPVPYTLYFEGGTDRLLDDYYGTPKWRERLIPYIVHVAPVHTDIRIPIDEAHELDGYGGIWRVDRAAWHLEKPPLLDPTLEGYDFPTPDTFHKPEWKAEAQDIIQYNPDSYIMANLGWGLFERSWNLRGFENLLLDSIREPDFFEEILDRLTNLYLQLVDRTVKLPVDGILFGDDWGHQQGIILGPKRWRKFLKPRWAMIYERVHTHGKTVFHHSCGSVAEIMPDLIEIGMDFLESVQPEAAGMNPYELKKRWGDKIGFWGGIGSQSVIAFGTPDDIRSEVRRLRQELGRDGGYILAPAKPLQPGTPVENAVALLDVMTEENHLLG